MAKKTSKPTVKLSAKSSSKGAAKKTPKSKPATKSVGKASGKVAKQKSEPAVKAKGAVKAKSLATASPKSQSSRPALMTARGKVKTEEIVKPVAKAKIVEMKKIAAESTDEVDKDFDNNGDQLIAMAKEEMSKINRTGDNDKAAEKTSKFKPIKIERGNLSDEKAKWQELNKRYGKEKAVTYKMSDSFESLKPIQHKVLGWGFILTNDNNRLEVLFENGIKMLISNYKAN
jgi:hypothetical protein